MIGKLTVCDSTCDTNKNLKPSLLYITLLASASNLQRVYYIIMKKIYIQEKHPLANVRQSRYQKFGDRPSL